ncbi:periplasmic heavy metal sensor [bacterium]|nr:periplasmic heavy metal sensor [bacterium]
MRKITLTLIIVLMAGAAFAQPPGRKSWRGENESERPPREMIEAFRLFKLTEELELTEEQTTKIYPILAELNNSREESQKAMREKMKELRDLLDEEKVDDRSAAKLALEIHDMRYENHEAHHKVQTRIMDLLDDGQKAKFVLFDQMFERHLHNVKERMHDRRDGEGRPGPPGGHPDGPPRRR